MSELYIGIDNGTQGTKCGIFDRTAGRLLATAYAPHELIENDAGGREQDPAWWIEAAEKTLTECLAQPGVTPGDVVAIAVSGQQHGMVPLDAAGRVIRPAKLWCDTETAPECDLLTESLGGADKVIAAIGNQVAAGFTASKILWLQRHEPEAYERLHTVLLPHDYLNFWLTGERATEFGDASGTAYFDIRNRTWSEPMLHAIDPSGKLKACMPRWVAADEPVGTLRPELAERFGLPPHVLVAAGGGDNMMAAIGTGNVSPGVVTASLGTSGTIYAYADRPVVDPAGELAAFCSSSGGWLPLVCTMNVTVATERFRNLFNLDLRAYDALVASAPLGAAGVVLLPYFNGERTPALPRGRAVLGGMTGANTTPANLCRAAMEGATLGLRYGLDVLRRQGVEPTEIRLVGGGAKSAIWRRITADVFNCPVVCPESPEAGVMGCILQAIGCRDRHRGQPTPIVELAQATLRLDDATRTEPDRGNADAYAACAERFQALNNALTPLFR